MQYSTNVQKIVKPIKIIWLMLSGSLLMYAFVLNKKYGLSTEDIRDVDALQSKLVPLTYVIFTLTTIFYIKKDALIRKNPNMEKAPYAKDLSEDDQKTLSYYGSYFVVHIILWGLNEVGAILGFLLADISGNILYYAYPTAVALFLNLAVMRPKYFEYIQGKRLE